MTLFISSTKYEEIIHEGPSIFRTLRGEEREKAKLQMRYKSPRMLQLDSIQKIDDESLQERYFKDLRMLSTYQKAKSEDNTKYDLHLCRTICRICFNNI